MHAHSNICQAEDAAEQTHIVFDFIEGLWNIGFPKEGFDIFWHCEPPVYKDRMALPPYNKVGDIAALACVILFEPFLVSARAASFLTAFHVICTSRCPKTKTPAEESISGRRKSARSERAPR